MIYKKETYDIIGAAMDVHRTLGGGFLESVYQEALEIELAFRRIPYIAQQPIEIWYKTQLLTKFFIADLLCYNEIIVELKAVSEISSVHEAQLINYLNQQKKNWELLLILEKIHLNTNDF